MSVLIIIILICFILYLIFTKKFKVLGTIVLFCLSVAGILYFRHEVLCTPNCSYIELSSGNSEFKVKIPLPIQFKWSGGSSELFNTKKDIDEIYKLIKETYPTEYVSDTAIRLRTQDIYVTISLMEKYTFKNLYVASLETLNVMHGENYPSFSLPFPEYYMQREEEDYKHYNDTDNTIINLNCTYDDIKNYYQYFSNVTWEENVCTINSKFSITKLKVKDNLVEILSVEPL